MEIIVSHSFCRRPTFCQTIQLLPEANVLPNDFENNFSFIREVASPEKLLQKLFEVKLKLCQRGPN